MITSGVRGFFCIVTLFLLCYGLYFLFIMDFRHHFFGGKLFCFYFGLYFLSLFTLAQIKRERKYPRKRKISATDQNLQGFQCTKLLVITTAILLLKSYNSKPSLSSFAALCAVGAYKPFGLCLLAIKTKNKVKLIPCI